MSARVVPLRPAATVTPLQMLAVIEAAKQARVAVREADALLAAVTALYSREHGYRVPLRPESAERLARKALYGRSASK